MFDPWRAQSALSELRKLRRRTTKAKEAERIAARAFFDGKSTAKAYKDSRKLVDKLEKTKVKY